jgi:hypothetical protein
VILASIGQRGVQMAPGLDDVFEKRIAPVLDVAQIGGCFAPGQVAHKRFAQVDAVQAGTHKGKVVHAQGSRVTHHLRCGTWWTASALGH